MPFEFIGMNHFLLHFTLFGKIEFFFSNHSKQELNEICRIKKVKINVNRE